MAVGGGLLEGNQLLFVVLLALVISGALRVGLQVRQRDFRHHDHCEVLLRAQEALRQRPGGGATALWTMPLQKELLLEGPQHPLEGPSWDLPTKFAQGFGPGPSTRRIDPSKFKLHIKVLVFDRVSSVERCLRSLEAAHYDGDVVDLELFVDHPFSGWKGSHWSAKAEARVRVSQALLESLDALPWSHGPRRIHYRTKNSGIQPQWLEAWWPETPNDFAFVVEDDMELSPLYYRYFKALAAHYYFNVSNFSPQVYGMSFQRQHFVAGEGGHPVMGSAGLEGPFLYQLVGTWGQFLFPAPWRQFRLWYDFRRYNESREPILHGLKTTQWWRNKGNKLWTPWIIKWAHARHMYNLYTRFPGNLSLSTSHREIGSNFRVNRTADARLIMREEELEELPGSASPLDLPGRLPPTSSLPKYDFCYRRLRSWPPARTLPELQAILEATRQVPGNALTLVMVPGGAYELARNWLCHVEGMVDTHFYVMVVWGRGAEAVGEDLASRGHATFLLPGSGAGEEGEEEEEEASERSLAASASERARREAVWLQEQLQLALSLLALGYHTLLCPADTVWLANPLPHLLRGAGKQFAVQGVLDASSLSSSFLFVRSEADSIAAWETLLAEGREEAAGHAGSSPVSFEAVRNMLTSAVSFRKVQTVPATALGDASPARKGDVVPVIMGGPGVALSAKPSQMAKAGLWLIDDYDQACRAVVCHKKSPPGSLRASSG
eukprot:TRINITY_DN1503_c5_g1_i1.p1 TRINITY_DN1503_c5_g1~~TRINITY_DN1503_c5_g1_i1.p1  ORF type:complete len:721 (+),score=183.29 TRINITY_DN1503_c5_g1_i1:310-2472(+)